MLKRCLTAIAACILASGFASTAESREPRSVKPWQVSGVGPQVESPSAVRHVQYEEYEIIHDDAVEGVPESVLLNAPESDSRIIYEDHGYQHHGGCDSCSSCLRSWMWGDIEYLLWWRQARSLPPLITSSDPAVALDEAGQLDQPTTETLLGGDIGDDGRPGGRITLGMWLDPGHCWSVEGRYVQLGEQATRFDLSSNDNPVIVRPFFNVTDGQPAEQDTFVISYPGEATGSVSVASTSNVLTGDISLRRLISQRCGRRVDFTVGYQFSRIDEDLTITSNLTALTAAQLRPAGTVVDLFDRFTTRNEFHGAQLGIVGERKCGCVTFEFLAKVGIGNMSQTVRIDGQTTIELNGATTTEPGLLARSTNIGTFSRDEFSVVPELGLKCGWAINSCLDLSVGYTVLVLTNVVQPGDQIDPNLAVNLDPNPVIQSPSFAFNSSDYWVHGLSAGLSFRY